MTAKPWDQLGGEYQLCPGAHPSVLGRRPVLQAGRLGALLRGKSPAQVQLVLSSVFTLCSHAHCRTANLLFKATQPMGVVTDQPEAAVFHLLETARDHLRSIALDWPQRLPEPGHGAATLDWLRGCPLPLVASRLLTDEAAAWHTLKQLRTWLVERILLQSLDDWLHRYREPEALAHWCQTRSGDLLPARCLNNWHSRAQIWLPEMRQLALLDHDEARQTDLLQHWARNLNMQADFSQYPTWLGQCAENGPWTRLRHRHLSTPITLWHRLSSRWLELMELANASLPRAGQHPPLLASGSITVADDQALAWCEMARGLLFHWAQWDAQGQLLDYHVVAPTEWNFHPNGALAQAVAALAPSDRVAAQTLAAAFDPCVACSV